VQSAWVVINDSLRSTICIRFAPKAVSAAAIYFAAKREGIDICQIVGNAKSTDPIEAEIFPDAPKDQVRQIVAIIESLYT
jgi:hypothetical protein